jgi:hypothetical protein
MKNYSTPLVLTFALLFAITANGCQIGDDLLWVAISKTSWETTGVDVEFREAENITLFTFNATGVFNNPNEEEYRIIHNDGCGFKGHLTYTPNNTIEDPLEGTDYYPMGCTEALMPTDYSHSRTEFQIFGGISFPGELTELPAGFYEISIPLPYSVDDEVTSINYMLLANSGLTAVVMRDYCGIPSETSQPSVSNISLSPVSGLITASTLGLMILLEKKR